MSASRPRVTALDPTGNPDVDWQSRGLCRLFVDDVSFVPDPFLGEDSEPAKKVCAHCPVIGECRTYAREHDELGVWGGEDEVDRLLARDALPTNRCQCDGEGAIIVTSLGAVCTSCGTVTG